MSLRIGYGPMFAGKTTALLEDLCRVADTQPTLKVVMINHSSDTRAGTQSKFSTHAGLQKVPNFNVMQTLTLHNVDQLMRDYTHIGIDEAQFFDDLVPMVTRWVQLGKHVHCVGLIADFRQQPFGHLLQLFCCADELHHFCALCSECLKTIPAHTTVSPQTLKAFAAPFSTKLQSNPPNLTITDVGGAEKYTAVCRKHYTLLNATNLTTTVDDLD